MYVKTQHRSEKKIYQSKFEHNCGIVILSYGDNIRASSVSIIQSEFIDNTVTSSRTLFSKAFISNLLLVLDEVMVTVSLSKFSTIESVLQ